MISNLLNATNLKNRKKSIWIDVLFFVAIVVADALGYLPITQTIYLVPFIAIRLWLLREPWSTIGWSLDQQNWKKHLVYGVVFGLLMETLATWGTTPFISSIFGQEPDLSSFKDIEGNLPLLLIFLGLSWTIAALGEEICFRGFLMQRLAKLLGENITAWILAWVLSSILFGWGHTEQGVSGWIQEGLNGLWLGGLFLLFNKNLLTPIIAHGVSNTFAFLLIYWGQYPGVG